ncbi:hypothetical protein OSB04_023591 [Centaurea solstitialis]|uniref:Chromo domain-containing protein n=1 Tax=Centaurea solstitialis TaxID=347529 RepID=A0AA38SJH3_9ASTR|nr:hypothetical protein OSB04_023591 [Centaurea solstitialis]
MEYLPKMKASKIVFSDSSQQRGPTKCLAEPDAAIPLQEISVDPKLNFVEEPVAVVDRKIRKLRNKEICLVKVQWKFHKGQECTWEAELEMRERYPHLFIE